MNELRKKDLNFIKAAHIKRTTNTRERNKKLLIILPTAFIVLNLLVFSVLKLFYVYKVHVAKQQENTITALSADNDYQRAAQLQATIAALQTQYDEAMAIKNTISASPLPPLRFFNELGNLTTNQVKISNYTFSTEEGKVVFNGKANGISETAAFVKRLRSSGFFSDVSYTGYTEEQVTKTTTTKTAKTEALQEMEKAAAAAAATAAANPGDVSAQMAAQLAAMQLATAKKEAAEDSHQTQVTVSGSGSYLFVITATVKE